ncbi:hypothetical protein MTR67_049848 [Solanum verrucosum]|nr:hypothetical protein MTR67_023483 [Solanum verrucosum]WMV45879.1 hypothetical protein MTR67_039264 [Solanum verrucosum]WMV56463.1 hypothetical protein MTR67_049848 [Solanum verrucosum]
MQKKASTEVIYGP